MKERCTRLGSRFLLGGLAVVAAAAGCARDSSLGEEASSLSATAVTQGGDELRSSWYSDEAQLAPSLVSGPTFGKLFNTAIQGQVNAQPLVSQGVLFVATQAN